MEPKYRRGRVSQPLSREPCPACTQRPGTVTLSLLVLGLLVLAVPRGVGAREAVRVQAPARAFSLSYVPSPGCKTTARHLSMARAAGPPAKVGKSKDQAEPGWLGLVLHRRGGLLFVKRVVPGWPADKGGLRAGDQILSVDGKLAQAPNLDEALDALAGPAGSPVVVSVMRPGLKSPVTTTLIRTARPVPSPPARDEAVSPEVADAEAVDEAVEAWSRGQLGALDRMMGRIAQRSPDQGVVMAKRLVEGLLDLGEEAAWLAAHDVMSLAVERFPESPVTIEIVRMVFRAGSPPRASMADTAQRAMDALTLSTQVPAAERASMLQEWARVRALGWIAEGKTGKGKKALDAIDEIGPVGLVAMRPNGDILWQVPVVPSVTWEDVAGVAMEEGAVREVADVLKSVLQLDEPSWIYPAAAYLASRHALSPGLQEMLTPRWLVKRPAVGDVMVETFAGDRIYLDEVQRGRVALLLNCTVYDRDCEDWRVALADLLGRLDENAVVTGIVTRDPEAPPSMEAWPVYRGRLPDPGVGSGNTVVLLDPTGRVVGSWGAYEYGLEYHVLDRVARFQADPDNGGPFLARGGVDRNAWTLRWTLPRGAALAVAWGGESTEAPRMWVLSPSGKLVLYEGGQRISSQGGLSGLDRLQVVELDGDPADEFVAYRIGDGLLEVLDGGPTPLWIAPEDDPIALVVGHDLDQDGLEEVFVARRGNGQLTCYRPDGTVRWRTRIPHGVASLTFGRAVWVGQMIAVGTTRHEVYLLGPDGRLGGRLDPGIQAGLIAFADVDGDNNDELIVGGRDVGALVPVDMNGDGVAELGLAVGSRQQLLFLGSGRLAGRLTWEFPVAGLGAGEFDGDTQQELSLLGGAGSLLVLDWMDPWLERR